MKTNGGSFQAMLTTHEHYHKANAKLAAGLRSSSISINTKS